MADITQVLSHIEQGDLTAADQLLPIVYEELRRLSSRKLEHSPDASLQLRHWCMKLICAWSAPNRSGEVGRTSLPRPPRPCRRVLVDRARRRQRRKHGADFQRVDLHDSAMGCTTEEILVVDELFSRLAEKHPREADVAKLRSFVGFNLRELAEALEIPLSTAHVHWNFAKTWLFREYSTGD